MRNTTIAIIALALLAFSCKTSYKLGQCEQLFLDLEKGTLNGVSPSVSMDQVKIDFPCFTGDTKEGSDSNCGGGVFYLKHDFYFYTHNNFIEVRKKFSGTISKPVLDITPEQLFSLLGTPDGKLEHKGIFTDNMTYVYQYSKKWGTLSFIEEEGSISEINMHLEKDISVIDYCF